MSDHSWRATLAWRGGAYVGWQRQPNGTSVQEVVEGVLGQVSDTSVISVTASGRTDSGVHARAQIVGFRLPVERTPKQIQDGLNSNLPPDIVCLSASRAPSDFCPRRWARGKTYRYRILNRRAPCPFRLDFVWHVKPPLDLASMIAAARVFPGTHDWSSFRGAGCAAQHPVRTVESVTLERVGDDEIQVEVRGRGFLRYQVRIMVGTLMEVGIGRLPVDDMARILDARDRDQAGRTAPAHGLTLMSVEMGDGPT